MSSPASPLSHDELVSLRAAYGRFVGAHPGRILLTGHSHQAWPDVAAFAMMEAFEDAAALADDKWSRILPLVAEAGSWVASRLGFAADDDVAFAANTHELALRLASALPASAPIVATTGEFHSIDRQLRRWQEEGRRVVWVDASPRESLAERLAEAVTKGVGLVAVSAVLFEDAAVVQGLDRVIERAVDVGAVPLVDAYHAFNVVPLDLGPLAHRAFVVGGGYKYAQLGEGICFLRVPKDTDLRPAHTGWFADFASLDEPRASRAAGLATPVAYGPGAARFAGATFEPTPFYRARAVMGHFQRFHLDLERLRAISLAQTGRLLSALDAEGLGDLVVTPRDPALRGGFVSVRAGAEAGSAARAKAIVSHLRERRVFVDARAGLVRLGPAPYLFDDELDAGVQAFARALRAHV